MSEETKSTEGATGITPYDHEYTKKLIVSLGGEAGMPVEFQKAGLEKIAVLMAEKGLFIVKARDQDTKDKIVAHLVTKETDTIYLNSTDILVARV